MVAWAVCPGEEAIAGYAAGRLSRSERDEIDAHLDTCSMCTELVAVLAKLATSRGNRPATSIGAHPATEPDDDPDRLLGGQLARYVLLARIGVGGMGVVYSAYDPELDRRVALKLLRRARPGDELRDEARAIAKLSHPNVVAVHDVGRVDGIAFVAMEYVAGVTLREWLAESRSPAAILDAFVQAGRGLAAAHAVGLVHRDVKPSNIMIDRDGRARVLDFGLALDGHGQGDRAGTPGYMAPEQTRGELVDARADQFSLCVALWEALAGVRPKPDETATLAHVTERVTRALRRGLASQRAARFPTLDDLLAELVPPPRRRTPWIVASVVALAALGGTTAFAITRARAAPTCSRAGDAIDRAWSMPQHDAVRASFAATKLSYAVTAANGAIAQLDDWTARWRHGAEASCKATSIDGVQPAALHALRQSCLDALLEQLRPVTALVTAADPTIVSRVDTLVGGLPAPERCAEVTLLSALPPLPPAERDRSDVAAVRARIADLEAALLIGRANQVAEEVAALQTRADATHYDPLRARVTFLVGRLDAARSHNADATMHLHAAARLATASRDLELLAAIWIELTKDLANDLRTTDEAEIFDGYVEALIPQLPDRATLEQQLEQARCNRNGSATNAAYLAKHCETAIALAEHASLPKLVIAARTRLGHFQRMMGQNDRAIATLAQAVDEAVRVFGLGHPDTAIAHYALGIAQIADKHYDAGIEHLQQSLAIRQGAFPEGSIQIAESLQGIGDAYGTMGKSAESVKYLDEALAMLDLVHEADSAQAKDTQILLGLSLEDLHRDDDALTHYLRAADIADRSLEHGEAAVAMALRLAAKVEVDRDHLPTALEYLERALRAVERGHAGLVDLGQTQYDISQVAFGLHDLTRARTMAEAARASYIAGGADKEDLDQVDSFLTAHHWR
jgi:tetratricopeptide (TPR) repeat protein